jgi:hypothetical protein
MKVVCPGFGRWDVLSPRRRNSAWVASRNLHHETSAVAIELHSEEIDTVLTDAAEMRERTRESTGAQDRDDLLLQRCVHGLPTHDVWLSPEAREAGLIPVMSIA